MLLPKSHQNQLDNLLESETHALILIAKSSSDSNNFVQALTTHYLPSHSPEQLLEISEESTPGIAEVRQITSFLKLKSRDSTKKKIAILMYADGISAEAQNALLKTLEEPPANSLIILCVQKSSSLLPTIHSRATTISLLPVETAELQLLIASEFPQASHADIAQALFIADGSLGLGREVLNNPTHPLKIAAMDAKQFISSSKYDNLTRLTTLSTDKTQFLRFLQALKQILHTLIVSSTKKQTASTVQRYIASLDTVLETETNALKNGAQIKLLCLNLILSF